MGSGDTQQKNQGIELGEVKKKRDDEGSPEDGSPSEVCGRDERQPCLSKNNNGNTPADKANSTNRRDCKTECCIDLEKNKKWIALGLIAIVIAIVILISVYGCRGIRDNEDDDKIDRSTFTQQQNFSGSFQLLQNLSSCETQKLAPLQEVLVDIYNSSPALEGFFEKAEAFCLRNDSAVVQYHLTFGFPEAQETELKNFTLSWEMVYNVFRQYLYEQDPEKSGPWLIDPESLKMYSMH